MMYDAAEDRWHYHHRPYTLINKAFQGVRPLAEATAGSLWFVYASTLRSVFDVSFVLTKWSLQLQSRVFVRHSCRGRIVHAHSFFAFHFSFSRISAVSALNSHRLTDFYLISKKNKTQLFFPLKKELFGRLVVRSVGRLLRQPPIVCVFYARKFVIYFASRIGKFRSAI